MEKTSKVSAKTAPRLKRLLVILAVCVITLGLDQFTKIIAEKTLKDTRPQEFLGGIFRLQYMENPGAFLGLGGTFSESVRFGIFVACVAVVMVILARSLWKEAQAEGQDPIIWSVGLALLFSGGLGNLIDRVFRGQGNVVDFMNVGIGSLRTGIFNVADMAILAGIFILMFKPRRKTE